MTEDFPDGGYQITKETLEIAEKYKSLTTGVYGGNSMNVTVPQHEWRIIWRTCRVANPYSGGYSINSGGIIIVYLPQDTRQQKKEQQA